MMKVAGQSSNIFGLSSQQGALRLDTLIRIRWLAVLGQTTAIFFVHYVLGFSFLIYLCLTFVGVSAWLNIFLRLRYPGLVHWEGLPVMGLLGYDILQLSSLLYLTGGIQNPFSLLLVVPVIISAATQGARVTIPLFVLALGAVTALVFYYQPLPWYPDVELSMPLLIKAGMWTSIALTMAFSAIYAHRLANESRKLADALAATEMVIQREQHLTTLDGLATAAAHELGTPLATISLVSKEILRDAEPGTQLYEDAQLLRSQARRCRDILGHISSLSSHEDENIARLSINVLMEEIASPHRDFDIAIRLDENGELPRPVTSRNSAMLYGLGNLFENAIDFANSQVRFTANWNDDIVELEIEDDGPGFPPGLIERIGEPYISSRQQHRKASGGGLGLGLFIAKTLLNRSGAQLVFENNTERGGRITGARVKVRWKRAEFETI